MTMIPSARQHARKHMPFAARRASKRLHTRSRGQSLVIFALSATVLIALAGLAVDAARAVDMYARMQRAAEAGALAGVLYMPNYYNTVRPGDTNSAISRASREIVKNGFGSVLATNASVCPATVTSIEVAICNVTGATNELRVTITENFNLVLLSAIGVTPVRLSASAQAEYLPPVQIGSRFNYFGDQVECTSGTSNSTCDPDDSGTHLQYFLASLNGPAEMKEQGDPMVYCEEGPSTSTSQDGSASVSPSPYNSFSTNHPAYSDSITNHCGVPGTTAGNPDQQPSGYSGPATTNTSHPGGYNYVVSVPTGISGATVWVFNPSYIPSDFKGNGMDQFLGDGTLGNSYFRGPNSEGIVGRYNGNEDAPLFYFTTTISVYSVTSLYDRSTDTLVASRAYPPYDAQQSDLLTHGCNTATQVYDPYWSGGTTANSYHNPLSAVLGLGKGCFTLSSGTTGSASPNQASAPAPCWLAWCQLPVSLNAGTYRLVVEATGLTANALPDYNSGPTDGWGSHSYALKVCATLTGGSPVGCSSGASGSSSGVSVYGWNNEDVVFLASLSQATPNTSKPATSCVTSNGTPYTCLDLGCISSAYAGRTVVLSLYDPGDAPGGDMYVAVVPPPSSGGTVTYTSPTLTTTAVDGIQMVHARFSSPRSYVAFNGLWLNATLTLPSTYVGDCLTTGTGWWQIAYASSNSDPHDKIGVTFSLVGSPVHLVPPSLG